MKVYQVIGYPNSHYFVQHSDWGEMVSWFYQNEIDWMQESSSMHGVGFRILSKFEWFLLRWV